MTSPALLGLLRETKAKAVVEEKERPVPSIGLLDDMTLSDFRDSDLVVVVRCAVLEDEVVFAGDRTATARRGGCDDRGRVIYSGDELRLLLAFAGRPEDLVAYHRMRQAVGRVEVVKLAYEPETEDMKTEGTA